jgi:YD repeat-containing protein
MGYYSGGKLVSFTRALGQPEQQTTFYQYDPVGTGLMKNATDALGRQTSYSYDSCGNMTGITRLAGTSSAVTTTLAYQTAAPGTAYPCVAVYNQITSITDPLSHATTFGYDSSGKNLTSVTDPLSHSVTIVPNAAGQPTSIADFAGTTQFSYTNGDLVSITDPTSNITRRTPDSAGRLVYLQVPLGQVTQYQYDPLNKLLQIIDPLNGQTNFTYDGNGNLLTLQDSNIHTTTYTPNSMDRVASRQDPLTNTETYQYDLNGNVSVFVDRKNQVATNTYDGLDRLTKIQYADLSTSANTYDVGNRLTQVVKGHSTDYALPTRAAAQRGQFECTAPARSL